MVNKQYSEEEIQEDIPEIELKHTYEDCNGDFVEEYTSAFHCPVCGAWHFDKKEGVTE